MAQKHTILCGAFILTAAGFISRILGFFYKIFLSNTIGAEGIGLYQLIFPVFGFALSFSASGISTAISHYVSGKSALKNTLDMRKYFYSGLFLSLILSSAAAFLIWNFAEIIAFSFLKDIRCTELLRCIALAIPFSALHSCILGYFVGLKRARLPAVSQLFEQFIRITSTWLFYQILLSKNESPGPFMAVAGILCSEIFSALFTVTLLIFEFSKTAPLFTLPSVSRMKKISQTAAPLSGNRLLITLLQSIEALLIPSKLRLFGYTISQALSQYGILTGMAFPLVYFPSAITGAISMLLLPTVSESQSLNNQNAIRRTIEASILGSLTLGIFCTGGFLLFGPQLGLLLFHNEKVGDYILILAWSCPFLYLTATLSSILNGLGKTMRTFIHNALGLGIRIFVICFFVPRFGLSAYLTGLLLAQLSTAFLSVCSLKREIDFSVSLWKNLLLPIAFVILSAAVSESANWFLFSASAPDIRILAFRAVLFTVTYLLLTFFSLRE